MSFLKGLLSVTKPIWGKIAEVGLAAGLGALVAWYLIRSRKKPDEKYEDALNKIVERWQKDVDSFASNVAKENVDAINAHLARYERRKLMRALRERADGEDVDGAQDTKEG